MDQLLADLILGLRTLRKSPGFTLTSIITLGLGIGANIAIFSAIDAVLLRPLPYPDSNRLVLIREKAPHIEAGSVSYPNYQDWCAAQRSFEGIALTRPGGMNTSFTKNAEPQRVRGLLVTWNTLSIFGLKPHIGRDFSPSDDQPGAEPVCMIGDQLWHEQFGGSGDVVGQRIVVNGLSREIVGVLPKEMQFGHQAQVWTPLADLRADQSTLQRGNHNGFSAIGRLKESSNLQQAAIELNTIAQRLEKQYPESNTGRRVNLRLLLESAVGQYRTNLYVLSAAVICVLLIACGNVAGLIIARGTARLHDLAIRSALGASRRRLTLQLAVESSILSFAGAITGLILAVWGLRFVIAVTPADDLRFQMISVNGPAFAAALLLAIGCALLAGVVPGWFSAGAAAPSLVLREAARGSSESKGRQRLRDLLLIGQVALALVLLSTAALLIKSFAQLRRTALGFQPEHLLLVPVDLSDARYPDVTKARAFYDEVSSRIAKSPAIAAVGRGANIPFDGDEWDSSFHVTGMPPDAPGKEPLAEISYVSPGYFHTIGANLLRGRDFTPEDNATSPKSVIIDDLFANRYFPNQDPIGKHIDDNQTSTENAPPLTVIGVVARMRKFDPSGSFEAQPFPEMFFSTEQVAERGEASSGQTFIVRSTSSSPYAALPFVKAAIAAVDPEQPVGKVTTMEESIATAYTSRRLITTLIGAFAGLAVLLTGVGLFAVIALRIAQRRRELGIRFALGAQRSQVFRMVIGSGLKLTGAGVIVGMMASFGVSRVVRGLVFGVSPLDPLTFGMVALGLCVLAFVAAFLPAHQASSLNPLDCLRAD
jgi:putative ABC transport system permease protein